MLDKKSKNNYGLFNKHLSKVSDTTINKFGSLGNVIIFLLELCECGNIGLVTKNFKQDSPAINHLSIYRIVNNDVSLKKCVKLAQSYAAEMTKADAEKVLRDRAINGYEEVTLDAQGECVLRKKKYCSKSLLEYFKYQNIGKSNYGNETNKNTNEIKQPHETAVFEIEAYESDNTEKASNYELNNLDEELSIKKQKDLAQIYSKTFSGKDDTMIIEDLAEQSGMYCTNFISDNDRHTAFLEGQRALLLYICRQSENNIEENKVINHE